MKILVMRFSAMGDVALLAPVLRAALEAKPDLEITILTRKAFAPFFKGIKRLEVLSVDIDGEYKGLWGLFKLYQLLIKTQDFDIVLDAHDHLRTRILSFFFKFLSHKRIIRLQKGRASKRKLVRKRRKVRQQLLHSSERYATLFRTIQIPVDLNPRPSLYLQPDGNHKQLAKEFLATHQPLHTQRKGILLGIAPFAKHRAKKWTEGKMRTLIQNLEKQDWVKAVYLFGGGESETYTLSEWTKDTPNFAFSVASALPLEAEWALMQKLDAFLSMDSSNMHMAALCGVKTFSIWGATHADAGFAPLWQPEVFRIEKSVEELPCRPCSVFGNKICFRRDWACLETLSPEEVEQHLTHFLATEQN
ncbi:MAG: glycosyltransferase family 9 protein [Bernardetiaceae bacterium]|nr:glycosyltransferase family 9 protein [Bernardetiaceae bacterium]